MRLVLVAKRQALDREAARIKGVTEDLLDSHRVMLSQLPVVLDDFRLQVAIANERLGTGTDGFE